MLLTMDISKHSQKASINRKCLWPNQTQLTTILLFILIVFWLLHWLVWVVSVDVIHIFQKLLTITGFFFATHSVFLCYTLFELAIESSHSMIISCPLLLRPYLLACCYWKQCETYHNCTTLLLLFSKLSTLGEKNYDISKNK